MRGRLPMALMLLVVAAIAATAVWFSAQDVETPVEQPARDAPDPVRGTPSPPDSPAADASHDMDPVAPPVPPADVDPRWRGSESLVRRVVARDGVTPVEGVSVTLLVVPPGTPTNRQPEPIVVATTTTAADGTFRFEGLARRSYQVRVEARHHTATTWTASAGGRPERRGAGSELAPGDMQIGHDLVVHFVVVTQHDAPVPGAVGEVRGPGPEPLARLTCDDAGRVDWLPPGGDVRAVVFDAPGRATEFVQGWRHGGDTRVVMSAGHVIAGLVVDDLGRPVQGASVALSSLPVLGDRSVVTGPDGAFRFDALRAHPTMRVVARRGDGAPAVVSTPTGREDVRIVMPPAISGGTVRGVVLRPDGTDAAGAVVDLSAACDENGRFEVHCTSDGEVTVGARYGVVELPMPPHRWHAEFGTAQVELPPGATVEGVTIRLARTPVSFVPVRLTDPDGRPLPGVMVTATGGGFGGTTDADGRAVVACVARPPGTATTIGIGGFGAAVRQRSDVVTRGEWDGPPEEIVVDAAGGRVSLAVVGVEKDEWDAVKVWAVARDRRQSPRCTAAGAELSFEIAPLDGGEHLVMIRYPRGAAFRVLPEGAANRSLDVEVDVRRGASLRVTIADADGSTPRDIRRVYVLWERAVPWGFVEVGLLPRNAEDVWTADPLPAGRFLLAVYRTFAPAAFQRIELRDTGTNTAHVVLPRRVTVAGEVRGPGSQPLGGCTVSLLPPGGRRPSDRFGPLATTGADGRFELTLDPLDGAYLVFAREGHATRLVPIDGSLATRVHRVALEREGTVLVLGGLVETARLPGTDVVWEPYVEPTSVSPPPGGTPLRRLPVGDVELIGFDDAGSPVARTVRVVPGRTVELDLRTR